MAKTVVVTGAGGYVGRHVVRSLVNAGVRVVALARESRRRPLEVDPGAEVVIADVLDADFDLAAAVPGRIDALVHLAWQDGFTHNAPSHIENLSAHFRFLEAAVAEGVGRVTILGSMHEVGYWEGAITESTPTNPLSLYGIAKDALRRSSLIALGDRAEIAWLRCFYIVGDDRANQSVFTKILEAVDAGRETFPFTTGSSLYDFIDVAELGRQIATVALADGEKGVINCCTGAPVSLREQVERFIVDHQLPITLEVGAFPDRPYDSPGIWGDATRIRDIMDRAR